MICLAHYVKDVLPIVRQKIFTTNNKPDNFFETIISAYSIKELEWKHYCDQLEFGIIECDTPSQKYKKLYRKYNLIYGYSKRNKWSLDVYVAYESYFPQW